MIATSHARWRRLRPLDVGRNACARPMAGVHHHGVLHAVHRDGLVEIRYSDGVLGAFPQGQVRILDGGES